MNQSKEQLALLECIKLDQSDKFIEQFETRKSFRRKDKEQSIDEFGLLTEIVKHERVNFLEIINKKQLFPIT